MHHRRAAGLLLSLVIGCAWPGVRPAAAQVSTSVLRGEVRDSANVPVPDVRVELRDASDLLLAGTETDERGRFLLRALPPGGPYVLAIERLGFRAARRDGVYLAAGEVHRLDVTVLSQPLNLPGVQAIAAPDPVFSGARTGAATLIEERAIETTPTVDRDITALAALSPMASLQEEAISVAGQNSRFNALRVDGGLSQDVFGLSPSGVPGGQANAKPLPLDAIRQYSVLVAPYDVRHSGFTGGLMNATTRSGGDEWAASVFAYYRDAALAGSADDSDVVSASGRGATAGFRTQLGGFTLGGPLRSARLFVAGEVERRQRPLPGFHVGVSDPVRVGVAADSVARFAEILRRYGHAPGEAGQYELANPLGNLFARVDMPVGADHELTLSYNWISAEEDVPAAHRGFGSYELSSAATRLDSETHSVTGRLESRLGEDTRNELVLTVQRTADATHALGDDPQVEVSIASQVGDTELLRSVRSGGHPMAHQNELEQTVLQLSDHLSHQMGANLLSMGLDASLFSVRRAYLPASRGVWRFNSLADLDANAPWAYERLILADDAEAAVQLGLLQLSGYLQDDLSLSDRFSIRLGVRLDLPVSLGRPDHNADLAGESGIATDRMPQSLPLFSPRVGFNWRPPLERRTQVRGGVGLFAGVPPMAWIADVYANTGLRTRWLHCTDRYASGGGRIRVAPAMGSDAPDACLTDTAVAEPDITVLSEDFRFPQDLRASLAVDHQLPGGFVATVEAVYTRAMHQVGLEDLNLDQTASAPPPGSGFPEGTGIRPYYGEPLRVPHRFGPLETARRWDGFGRVIRIGNGSRNAALAAAAELQRRFSDRVAVRLAYTYTRAIDTRSLLYPDAALNYGLSPTRGDPGRPEPRPSSFDRPHRILGSAWVRLAQWGAGLDASAVYVGQSGLPYSYVYETDMNGDGYPGPGAGTDAYNDLYYVPRHPAEIPASIGSAALLVQLQAIEPCLGRAEGGISARNSCRAPWSNRLDLRLAQAVQTPLGRVRVSGDIMNVLNLLNGDWGLVHVVPPAVPILSVDRRSGCPGLGCTLEAPLSGYYTGPRQRDPQTDGAVAALPYTTSLPDSHWRAQLGIKVEF